RWWSRWRSSRRWSRWRSSRWWSRWRSSRRRSRWTSSTGGGAGGGAAGGGADGGAAGGGAGGGAAGGGAGAAVVLFVTSYCFPSPPRPCCPSSPPTLWVWTDNLSGPPARRRRLRGHTGGGESTVSRVEATWRR
uniref:Uncharacterized protein n=1 Tax=Gasterosteus aculeatus TaxID=69293 RepID=G3PEI8_GASAC